MLGFNQTDTDTGSFALHQWFSPIHCALDIFSGGSMFRWRPCPTRIANLASVEVEAIAKQEASCIIVRYPLFYWRSVFSGVRSAPLLLACRRRYLAKCARGRANRAARFLPATIDWWSSGARTKQYPSADAPGFGLMRVKSVALSVTADCYF